MYGLPFAYVHVYIRVKEKKKKEIGVEFCRVCISYQCLWLSNQTNVYSGRKVYLLKDKQIPSVGVFDEVFSNWKEFGGNTHDLGSFGEETDKTTDLHQNLLKIMLTELGDGVASIKRRRHELRSDDEVPDIVLIITPSYELRFQRFNSPRVQNKKIYNFAKKVMVTVSHVIGDAVMKCQVICAGDRSVPTPGKELVILPSTIGSHHDKVEFFEGWKPLSPLQLAMEEVMSE
ncbi:hypothetical protein Tco_0011092 [Tanacetum coccineum]